LSGAKIHSTVGHGVGHVYQMSTDVFDASTNRLAVDGDPSRMVSLADAGCARTSFIASNVARPLTNTYGAHKWSSVLARPSSTHCECTLLGAGASSIVQRVHRRLGAPANVQSDGVTPVQKARCVRLQYARPTVCRQWYCTSTLQTGALGEHAVVPALYGSSAALRDARHHHVDLVEGACCSRRLRPPSRAQQSVRSARIITFYQKLSAMLSRTFVKFFPYSLTHVVNPCVECP